MLITVLSSLIGSTVDTEVANAAGGFGMRARFNPSAQLGDPVKAFTSGRFAGKVEAVAPLRVAQAKVRDLASFTEPLDVTVVGADRTLLDTGGFKLNKRLERFADDQAAWQAVLTDPGYVVLEQYLGQEAGPALGHDRHVEAFETPPPRRIAHRAGVGQHPPQTVGQCGQVAGVERGIPFGQVDNPHTRV